MPPENELPRIPENELVLINQINILLVQLMLVQAGNRPRQNEAGELEQLNAAADQLIGTGRREALAAQTATLATALPVPVPAPALTPTLAPTPLHLPISPSPPPPTRPPARNPPDQLETTQALDKGGGETKTAFVSSLSQRPPKRIKPTLVVDNKEKGKALVEKRNGKAVEAPILPLILLSRKQYADFKKLVGQSVGLKKIPHWTNNLKDGSDWDRREFRCLRRNAFFHNTRLWAGWKRNHMALLTLGIMAVSRRGRGMELDAFINENRMAFIQAT